MEDVSIQRKAQLKNDQRNDFEHARRDLGFNFGSRKRRIRASAASCRPPTRLQPDESRREAGFFEQVSPSMLFTFPPALRRLRPAIGSQQPDHTMHVAALAGRATISCYFQHSKLAEYSTFAIPICVVKSVKEYCHESDCGRRICDIRKPISRYWLRRSAAGQSRLFVGQSGGRVANAPL